MNEVFADTSYFIALVSPSDDAHERARARRRKGDTFRRFIFSIRREWFS